MSFFTQCLKKNVLFTLCMSSTAMTLWGVESGSCNTPSSCAPSVCPDPCPPTPCSTPCPLFPETVITPDAAVCVRSSFDLGISADFIYWYVREQDLSFLGYTNVSTLSSSLDLDQIGNLPQRVSQHFKIEPGFKVGLDIALGYDGWDLFCQYTWLNPQTNKTVSINPNSETTTFTYLRLTLPTFNFMPNFTVSSIDLISSWHLQFNVIDLELARNFFISPKLTLRPHVGLKGTWQKQIDVTQAAPYLGDLTVGLFPGFLYGTTMGTPYKKDTMKSKGLGIRTGLDANWFFFRTFSLFADVAATALWEVFKTKTIQYVTLPNAVLPDIEKGEYYYLFTNQYLNHHAICPVVESEIGLRFETWFGNSGYHLCVEGGWELQWWFAQNKIGTFGTMGDLMIQGLTISTRLDF